MRVSPRLPLLVAVPAWLAIAPVARAQGLDAAARFVVAGDTAAAMEALERLLHANRRNAEAHFQLALLYRARVDRGAAVDENRRKAEEHLRYATRLESDSAKYAVALAEMFRRESNGFTRVQIPRLLDRARDAAERAGDAAVLTDLEYRSARVEWERWEHFGRRYVSNDFAGVDAGIDPFLFYGDWHYVERYFAGRARPASRRTGEASLLQAEDHLWASLEADPGNIDGAGLLMVLMSEEHRWPEVLAVARGLLRAAPDSGRAWALVGYAMAREHRWREAEAAFDSALARLDPADRKPYLDLGRIMRAADHRDYLGLTDSARARLDTTYWATAQPLALTETNELRAEFFARITYVEHRWADPVVGYHGVDTDIGRVYVRYGPPDIWAVFGGREFPRTEIAWVYAKPRFRFLFDLTNGFARAYFADFSRESARVATEDSPARFDNVPIYRTLDTILVQAAQFRGADPRQTSVVVTSAIPVRRMIDSARVADLALRAGVTLTSERGDELARDRRDAVVHDVPERPIRYETWTLSLPPREYLMRVEAQLPAVDRGARSAGMLRVRGYRTTDRLLISDVLAAGAVAPRDSTYRRWTDFFLQPNAGRFAPGDPVGLLWEIYNLSTDSTGLAHYTVDLWITVDEVERHGWSARLLGGIGDAMGLTAAGDDRVQVTYDRSVVPGPDGTQVEYMTVDLRDAPNGRYTIGVAVTDRLSGVTAERQRVIWVGDGPTARE